MSTFSTNQVRHLYVCKNLVTEKNQFKAPGDFMVATPDITKTGDVDKVVYFKVWGADKDQPLKSDYIPVRNINYIKAVKAVDMRVPMKKVKVTLSSDVNEGKPIIGEDYILRINLRQFYGMSDQDQYFKDAAVRGKKASKPGKEAEEFYTDMVKALNLSFSRELGATKDSNPYLSFTAQSDGIIIEEKEQPWTLGTQALERVYFDVVPTTVYDGTDDYQWGTVEEQTSTTFVGNGKNIADLEYFLLGERGDQYRKIGFPNDIETKGLIDSSKNYDIVEIHYAFTDAGVSSYRSEKDITIAIPSEGDDTFTKANALIDEINKATGLTAAKLAKSVGEQSINDEIQDPITGE